MEYIIFLVVCKGNMVKFNGTLEFFGLVNSVRTVNDKGTGIINFDYLVE